MKVAIVGAGNFGTAIANIVAKNGFPAYLWMRDPAQLADMRAHRENRRYLKGHPLDDNVVPSGDLAESVGASDILFVTVPSASFRQVTRDVAAHAKPGAFAVSGTKGVESDGFRLMSQILDELLPECGTGVISRAEPGGGDRRRPLHRYRGGEPLRGPAGGRAARAREPDAAGLFQRRRLRRGARGAR